MLATISLFGIGGGLAAIFIMSNGIRNEDPRKPGHVGDGNYRDRGHLYGDYTGYSTHGLFIPLF